MPTQAPTKAEDLKRHVQSTRTVTVKDKDGNDWTFKLRMVSMLLWDPTKTLWQQIGENPENFHEGIKESVQSPSDVVVRRVIIDACQEPRVTDTTEKGTVPIMDLMRHDILVVNLYAEIVNHSFSGILKIEASDARSSVPHSRR